MILANISDKDRVVEILTQSFFDNQSVNYIIRQQNKESEIMALMDYSFEQCFLFGEVYLSDDKNACALILYPQKKRFSFKAIWLDIKLIIKAIGVLRILKALNRESAIKKLQPKVDMAYLWFIGVDPNIQHKGSGSKLLSEVIDLANRQILPLFLETSTLTNLPWYKRFGFEIYEELDLGYKLYFLKNEKI